MNLRDLFVSIGFDVKDEELKRLDKGLANTKRLIFGVGAVATVASGLLVGLARQVAGVGDQAAKTADKLGVGVEALQEMRYAAELSGVAQSNFDTGLQRLTRRAAEAARGTGEAKDALRELGVVLTDGNGRVRASQALLADIADGMARVEDPSRRVALAFKLFDTEGVGMVNMLKNGGAALREMRAEARGLGFVISEADARNSEKFNDEMTRARLVLVGIKNAIGVGLLPMMIRNLKQFRQWASAHREIIKVNLEAVMRALIALVKQMSVVGRVLYAVLADLVDRFGGLERAMRMAGITAGIFLGMFSASAIGNVVAGIGTLISSIRHLGNVSLIANAKAAVIPVLIGAGVMALILILQDLYTYFTGGKSVTGVLIDAFEKKFPQVFKAVAFYIEHLKKLFLGLRDFVNATLEYLVGLFTLDFDLMGKAAERMFNAFMPLIEHWRQGFGDAIEWISEKLQPVFDMFGTVAKSVGGMLGSGTQKLGGLLASGTQGLGKVIENAFSIVGLGPATAPAGTGGTVNRSHNIRVNAPINVSVPEGTPSTEVAGAVQRGISDGISRMLNETADHLSMHESP